MTTTIGRIELIATIDTSDYRKGEKNIVRANQNMESSSSKVDRANSKTESSFVNLAKNGIKVAATAATALTTAIGALALTGGFDRALNIEDAQAKLRGLGHDAESVETIMDNALASVKGTAFGLDAAATTAANAVASGIKPGEELEQVLKTVANTASVAGRGMDDLGAIFNKVAASNKVQMDVINQLHDAGVPALALIAEEIGKTAEETAKMASDGEINFEIFERAMRKGVGDAALEMGKTTRGAMANVRAAFSRAGAVVADKVLPGIREGLMDTIDAVDDFVNEIPKIIDGVTNVARDIGSFLSPSIGFLVNQIQRELIPAFQRFVNSDAIRNISLIVLVAIQGLTFALGGVVTVLSSLIDIVRIFNPLIIGIGSGVLALTLATKAWSAATTIMTIAQRALNIAMRANPIILVTTGIVALTGAVISASNAMSANRLTIDRNQEAYLRLKSATDGARTAYDLLQSAQQRQANAQLNLEGATLAAERAQQNYNDVLARNPADSLEAREAAHRLERAQQDVKNANNEVSNSEKEVNETRKQWQKELGEQQEALRSYNDEIYRTADASQAANDAMKNLIETQRDVAPAGRGGNVNSLDSLGIPGLATGGVVTGPTVALIGEGRQDEAVIPLDRLDNMLQTQTSGKNTINNYTINQDIIANTPIDMRQINRNLTWELSRS